VTDAGDVDDLLHTARRGRAEMELECLAVGKVSRWLDVGGRVVDWI